MDGIGWYGWLIDYWMEGGILRDYFDHKLTTAEHWAKLREPETFTYREWHGHGRTDAMTNARRRALRRWILSSGFDMAPESSRRREKPEAGLTEGSPARDQKYGD